ncbi:hypothetical protein [Methylobacterium planeticum]|uniref:Glycosyltransferase RgtA/B/C/D-like domain-containing protein n=1 Tax=Methylobacterium planeticum TaxID=2615211 RepID=A0A6N6MP54_9HYPH|nr:hypothetical protein [Methylobacterium planeticum]KAB1072727.1 hypothetical protein F6X51_14025 [Methylobacterium planeticum]
MTGAPAPTRRLPALRGWIGAGLALTGLLFLIDTGSLLRAAVAVLPYPYEFNYGEGIVWQQLRTMLDGRAYAPLTAFPAIVYHYPPVYYLTSGAFAHGLDVDALVAGRLVSLLATLASAVLVGILTRDAIGRGESRAVRRACAGLAGLSCFVAAPVVNWAPLMRVDMLACAFSLAGLVLAVRALERPRLVEAAALAFVLAVYTKQVSIAAPAAAFLVLYRVRPERAWRLLAGCVAMGSAALVILCALTDGGFVRHVFLYNVNRIDPQRILYVPLLIGQQVFLVAAAVLGATRTWPQFRNAWAARDGAGREGTALLLAGTYLAIKTLLLPMVIKVGSAENYFTEWSYAVAVFVGLGLRPAVATALHRTGASRARPGPILVFLVLAGLPAQAILAPRWDARIAAAQAETDAKDRLTSLIRAADRPVISDDMTLPIRAGRDVLWEPAIAAELAHTGLYDEAAFVAMVRAGAFGFFATTGQRGDPLFDQRYNPPVAEAMDAAYPVKRQVGSLTVHLPAP